MSNPYYQGPRSDHFDGERFFHPGLPSADKGLLDILRWKLKERPARWPKQVPARSGVRPAERVEEICVTAIGHASLLIQVAGCNLLIDPVWSERASPLRFAGPKRHNPPAVALDHLPPIDAILLTLNHYDHMDVRTLQLLWKAHRPAVIAPLGNDAVLRKSVPGMDVQTGDWWDSFALPGNVRTTIVPAYHWSSRNVRDRRMALWGGFMLETPAGLIYCAGDTAFRDGAIFHQIRERFGRPALALLPIGAYAPRWFMETQHADPADARLIEDIIEAEQALGIHWATFQLTDEPCEEPELLLEASTRLGAGNASRFAAFRAGDQWQREAGAGWKKLQPEEQAPVRESAGLR